MDAKESLGEPRVLISRSALVHNARVLRRCLDPKTKLCAVIKADAYGHGAHIVVDALTNWTVEGMTGPAVDAFAVASIDEAAELPHTSMPVLILRPVENAYVGRQRQRIELAIRKGWVLTICTAAAADDVARIAMAQHRQANVQVQIDTGMGRSGAKVEILNALIAKILSLPALRLWGLGTHFANSEDVTDPFTRHQFGQFCNATEAPLLLELLKASRIVRHAANSGAIFFHTETHLDMVRPGIALYGIDPTCRPNLDRPLRPALKWTAPLIMIRDIKAGDAVGYGQTWRSPRDTRIGLIPVGYADGYMRSYSNRAAVLVHHEKAPVVGRVSMDLITIDLGDIPQARLGDEAILLDSDPLSPVSAYQLADWGDTIPYEVFCRIGTRIHRIAIEPEGEFGAEPATQSEGEGEARAA